MRRKQLSGTARGVLVILATMLILASSAEAAAKYTTLHKFAGPPTDGSDPDAGLIFDSLGNLYGTTVSGGSSGNGMAFELSPNSDGTWTETVLYSFQGSPDPSSVRAGLLFDSSGNLYGTSWAGGVYNEGTVYELSPSPGGGWTESVLYSFTGSGDGAGPVGGLVFDAAGNLYGTTTWANVFELIPNGDGTWTEAVIFSFDGSDGAYPDHSNLIFDAAGNLYGVTAQGGEGDCSIWTSGCGVVFELTPNGDGTWNETVLHLFSGGNDGANPEATLIFDASGNLYGTTMNGGAYGDGVVYKLMPKANGKWKEQVLHAFKGGTDGAHSWSGLVFDANGNLYGTTVDGGAGQCNGDGGTGCGTVYELSPKASGGWKEHVLHRFPGTRQANPYGELLLDSSGNLYGMDSEDTTGKFGTVFEITP